MHQSAASWASLRFPHRPAWAVRWAEAERGRFVPWLAAAMVAGAAAYAAAGAEPPQWLGPALLAACLLSCILCWRWPLPRGTALLATMLVLGFAAGQARTNRLPPMEPLPRRATVLSATVRNVDALAHGRRLTLDAVQLAPGEAPSRRMVRVTLKKGDDAAVAAGDQVQIRALLRPPYPPSFPGAWDPQRQAFFNGLDGQGRALNPVKVLRHAAPTGWAGRVSALRDGIIDRAIKAVPGSAGPIAAAFLTGSTVAIASPDREAFRIAGLAHLLAVSGLHMGIVMGLFMTTARFGLAAWPYAALHWPTKTMAAGVALLAGGGYLVLTGAHVPIVRSFAMACLVTLAIAAGRRALSMRGLAIGAAAVTLIVPEEVTGPSFQMSFAAVLALIAGYEAMRPALTRLHGPGWRRLAGNVAALLLTSLLAGAASAPFGAFQFGQAQPYFIAANLIAVPITAMWVAPLGVLGALLMPFGLHGWALAPMGWGIDAILWVAREVASWPAAAVRTPAMPGWGLAVYSFGFAWLCLWRTRARLLGIPVMLAGLLSPLALAPPDVLVSSDARLIAWRGPEGYRLQAKSGASRFVREAWEDYLGTGPLAEIADGSPASCDARTCRMGSVLLLREDTFEAECAGVSLLVSAEPARDVCPRAALLDRFTVWRDGAHAVWLRPGGSVVLSDRTSRGERPWTPPPPPRSRRVAPDLPMAKAETLPLQLEDDE